MKTSPFINQPMRKNIFVSKGVQRKKLRDLLFDKILHTTVTLTRTLPKKPIRCLQKFTHHNAFSLITVSLLMGFVFLSPTFSVAVEDLRAPIQDLKNTIFGGWMWVPKIGAAVGGCLLAVYNQSIMPLATGAGIGLGIHFYDLYINADGALI